MLKINERKKIIESIREQAHLLHRYSYAVVNETNPLRQEAIDHDLQTINSLLIQTNQNTAVHSAALNDL